MTFVGTVYGRKYFYSTWGAVSLLVAGDILVLTLSSAAAELSDVSFEVVICRP